MCRGLRYKKEIIALLETKGIETTDFGPFNSDSCDYPDFVHPVATAIENKECDLGIIICGSGNGIAMTANKHQEIRCAVAWDVELAALARAHNDANIVAIPARFVTLEKAQMICESLLSTPFEGGRHQSRVDKIRC